MSEAMLVESLDTLQGITSSTQNININGNEMESLNEGVKTLIQKLENIGNALTNDITRLERDVCLSVVIGLGVYSVWKWINNDKNNDNNKSSYKNKSKTNNNI